MRNAVFLSTGLGNALLLVPLLKTLKSRGEVVAFCTSPYFPEQVFEGFEDPPIDRVVLLKNRARAVRAALKYSGTIDAMYLDHFSSTPRIFAFSRMVARHIHCVSLPDPKFAGRSYVTHHPPSVKHHEAQRYLALADPDYEDRLPGEDLFRLEPSPTKNPFKPSRKYITLQPGSGSNAAPWKNLPVPVWAEVTRRLLDEDPEVRVIVLGEDSESGLWGDFSAHPRVEPAFDKYALAELPELLAGAELHLGGDSFLMHLSGCVGTPSFTVWGGSDPDFYGWNRIAPHRHGMLYARPSCGPCSRWLEPNRTRVSDPAKCPDFRCLTGFTADDVFEAIVEFRNNLPGD